MGVVSACLPSLRPLVSLLFRGKVSRVGNRGASRRSSAQEPGCVSSAFPWRNRKQEVNEGYFDRMDDESDRKQLTHSTSGHGDKFGNDVSVHGGRADAGHVSGDEISLDDMSCPNGQINIKEEVTVVSSGYIEYKDRVF